MEELNFEEMRAQIALLKNKVEKEELVNDRLLREIIKTKVRTINAQCRKVVICGVFCMVIFPYMHFELGLSWLFVAATIVMMIFCVGMTIYFHSPINSRSFIEDDVKPLAQKAARLKKQYQNWLHYVTPTITIPWVGWYCFEVLGGLHITGESAISFVVAILVGGAIGALIGYMFHKKVVDSCDDIISQLEE